MQRCQDTEGSTRHVQASKEGPSCRARVESEAVLKATTNTVYHVQKASEAASGEGFLMQFKELTGFFCILAYVSSQVK